MFGARIFISYARGSTTSQTLLTGLEPVLRDAGHEPLRDDQTLEPGDAFRKRLARMMMRCDGALLLLSPEALESQWVRIESQVLTLKKLAEDDAFMLVPWLLPGVRWSSVPEDHFPVADLREFQGLSGLETPYEDVAALFRRVRAARKALGEGLGDLAGPVRRDIARELQIDVGPTEGVASEVATLIDEARRSGKYDALWTLVEQKRTLHRATGDLAAGLETIARTLDGHPEMARQLQQVNEVTTNPELARRLVEDTRRTLEQLVDGSSDDLEGARAIAQVTLPWTPLWRDGGQVVEGGRPNLLTVRGVEPAHASPAVARRVGAPDTLFGTSSGLASRSALTKPAALSGDIRRTPEAYADALCAQILANTPNVPKVAPEVLRLLARGSLGQMKSPTMKAHPRQFRYVVDELDDVVVKVAELLPELFVVVLEPLSVTNPERVMEYGAVLTLLAALFTPEDS